MGLGPLGLAPLAHGIYQRMTANDRLEREDLAAASQQGADMVQNMGAAPPPAAEPQQLTPTPETPEGAPMALQSTAPT